MNIYYEEALINAVMARARLPAINVTPADFTSQENAEIWEAILDCDRQREPISILIVLPKISASAGLLLNSITSQLADPLSCDWFAQKVASTSRMRSLRDAMMHIAQEEQDFKRAAERIEKCIVSLQVGEWSGFRPLYHFAKEHVTGLETCGINGINTGVTGIDHKIMGMRPGHLYAIGGRPSNGKTMLALKIALDVAERSGPVTYFLLETSGQQMAARALTFKTKLPSFKLLRGDQNTPEDWRRIASETDGFERVPLFIDESADLALGNIRSRFIRAKEEFDSRLIVLDFLQLVHSKGGSEREKVNSVLEVIKPLAKETGVPILLLSQLSRKAQYERPVMAHFKETGRIEEDVDVAMLVFRHQEVPRDSLDFKLLNSTFQQMASTGMIQSDDGEELVWLDIAKNRQSGRIGLIPMKFSRTNMQLEEMDLM